MDKINFEDLPSKKTPFSARIFNLMQDNIERAIIENRGVIELIGTSSDPINANNVTTAGVYKVSGDKTNFYVNDGTFILFVQIVENRGNVTLIQHMLTQNGLAIRTGTYEIIQQEIYWNFSNWELQSGAGGGDTLPVGTILAFSGDTAPEDFLFCRGQAVSRTTYSELFEVIGTQYGSGDGSTTFNLPDYRSRVAVGLDSNDTDFDTLGETGGGTAQENLRVSAVTYGLTESQSYRGQALISKVRNDTSGAVTIDNCDLNLMPPYITQNFIIKFKKTTITDGEVIQETDTATTENVYSASAVDNKLKTNIITGQEVATNEYVDGNQVFVKRINLGALPNASQKKVSTGLTNISMVKPLLGYAINTNGTIINLPHVATSTISGGVAINLDSNGDISISTGNDRSTFTKSYVDMYYVKNQTSGGAN